MIKRTYNSDYQMRELLAEKEGGNIILSWRFKKATHFLIFLYDINKKFAFSDVLEEVSSNIKDEDIVNSLQEKVYSDRKGSLKVFCIEAQKFLNSGRKFCIKGQEINKNIPYTISVFACDEQETTIYVYEACEKNEVYLPIPVDVDIQYKRIGLILGRNKKRCILKLPYFEGYKDGAVMYHIDGVPADFPLTSGCMGKDVVITIDSRAKVCIRIQQEYKKYYKKV